MYMQLRLEILMFLKILPVCGCWDTLRKRSFGQSPGGWNEGQDEIPPGVEKESWPEKYLVHDLLMTLIPG